MTALAVNPSGAAKPVASMRLYMMPLTSIVLNQWIDEF